MIIQRRLGRRIQPGMVREAKVVVGAKVNHFPARVIRQINGNLALLGRGNHPFTLEQSLGFYRNERFANVGFESFRHGELRFNGMYPLKRLLST